MRSKFQRTTQRLTPFIVLGVSIAALIALLILLAHVVIAGVFIGLLIYAGVWVRQRFFPKSQRHHPQPSGRVFEHDQL